jgi:16S rRNA (guanine966-N2)-methyltransferase
MIKCNDIMQIMEGKMRIITGIAKGRKIKSPEGMGTRPTLDRVKVSIFNILNNKINGAKVLDLFAGTGSLGLEAISRYAETCTMVEWHKPTFNILNENISTLGFEKNSITYNIDAIEVLGKLNKKAEGFDIIFLDPPYGQNLVDTSVTYIDKYNLLNTEGVIMSKYDSTDTITEKIGNIRVYRTIKYGRSIVSFWSKEVESEV